MLAAVLSRASLSRLTLALVCSFFVGLPSLAAEPKDERPIKHPFQVTDADEGFAPVVKTLEMLVIRGHGPLGKNRLCVIGQAFDDGDRQAWIYWPQGNALVLWERQGGGVQDLTLSRRYLKLNRDVVPPTDKTLPTSTYLISTTWLAGLVKECATEGKTYTITRHGRVRTKGN